MGKRFAAIALAVVVAMFCGFLFGILYTATNAEIYVTHDNTAYLQIAGQAFVHEFE